MCDVVIAVYMTYLVRRPHLSFFSFILNFTQLFKEKSIWKQTQCTIHKLIRLILETGMLTGQPENPLSSIPLLYTAAIAITNFCLFLIPSTAYYQTTALVLGKMYSNSMMVVLNSRMEFRIANDTMVSGPGSLTGPDPVF